MKAIQFSETGGPEVLEYVDLSDPTAGPGEVLVKAQAFGVGKPDELPFLPVAGRAAAQRRV